LSRYVNYVPVSGDVDRVYISAVGCADLNMPFGGWWRRDGPLTASSGCGQSGHLWHWTCSDESKWIPDHAVVNCTVALLSGSGSWICCLVLFISFSPFMSVTL